MDSRHRQPSLTSRHRHYHLTKRLTAAERLDDLRRKHVLASATAPPSVTDGIDANLQGRRGPAPLDIGRKPLVLDRNATLQDRQRRP